MSPRILSATHDLHGLTEVQRVSQHTDTLSVSLRSTAGVEGLVTLATCNRLEFMIGSPRISESHLRLRLVRKLDSQPDWAVYEGEDALTHLFRVASGLESMVVGEREIMGQLRRALKTAQASSDVSGTLTSATNAVLHTSRRVNAETRLQESGRSVVSVGLDMTGITGWENQRVLLVGTGSYASAVVAALRQCGVGTILVYSSFGRATGFAERHAITPALDLDSALGKATLVVTCRGSATPVVTTANLKDATPTVLLDLSLQPGVDPAVASLPGIILLDLTAIQAAISLTWVVNSVRAEQIVAERVYDISDCLTSRAVNPAVASLRAAMLRIVDEEMARLPQGHTLTIEDCVLALRHLTTKLLHIPSIRARDVAAEGRIADYLAAVEELYGADIQPDFDAKGHRRCPVTGLNFVDPATGPMEIR